MIKLTRVDHRLLHGQVAFKWSASLGTDCILIANDGVAKDELRQAALRMAKPNGVKLVIKSINDSIKALLSGVTDKYHLMIIVESIADAKKLCDAVAAITEVNLGGTKTREDRRQISKAIFVSEDDCQAIKAMNEKGIRLYVQMVPDETAEDAMKLI